MPKCLFVGTICIEIYRTPAYVARLGPVQEVACTRVNAGTYKEARGGGGGGGGHAGELLMGH